MRPVADVSSVERSDCFRRTKDEDDDISFISSMLEQGAKIEAKRTLPDFRPGDTVRVNVRVTEGTRTRVQAYEGVCIARSGGGIKENFTVRKISYGEGVERVFPVYSPMVESVDIVRRGKVRRAKLYYLRDLDGKSARIVEEKATARTRQLFQQPVQPRQHRKQL